MSSKNLPANYSIEDLLKSLESTEVQESTPDDLYENEYLKFISFYGLEAGDNKVRYEIINALFKMHHPNILSPGFNFTKYLPRENDSYKLNKSALQIGEILYKKMHSNPKSKSKHYQKHFELYLTENNIKRGKDYVECAVLFYLYDEWRFKRNLKTKMGLKSFAQFPKFYFDTKMLTELTQWYGIDLSQIPDLTPEKLQHIREWYDKFKKKQPKISKKVSSIRSKAKPKKPTGTN